MRIAVIGQQAFAKSVLEAFVARGDEVAGVFCTPEKQGSPPDPLRLAAESLGIKRVLLPSLKGEAAETAMRELEVDLAVMAYVLQIVPQTLVDIPRCGTIQYHPSLLPKYRGPSSINWPIIKGDTQTGLTISRPTDGFDEGPIILQKIVAIGPNDTVGSLYFEHLFPLGVSALVEAADLVTSGRQTEVDQDETEASYEGWCHDEEARINWHAHIDLIHNLIRGCDPTPGAWTGVHGMKVRMYESRKHPAKRFGDVGGKPGEIVLIDQESVHIAAQGGTLEVFKGRVGTNKKLPAPEIAESLGLVTGTRLDAEADNTAFDET